MTLSSPSMDCSYRILVGCGNSESYDLSGRQNLTIQPFAVHWASLSSMPILDKR